MCEPRLSGLAMLHVHYTRPLDIDAVVRLFMRRNSRHIVAAQPFLDSDSESSEEDSEEAEFSPEDDSDVYA